MYEIDTFHLNAEVLHDFSGKILNQIVPKEGIKKNTYRTGITRKQVSNGIRCRNK